MIHKISILLGLIILVSCSKQTQEKTDREKPKVALEKKTLTKESPANVEGTKKLKPVPKSELSDCDKYWRRRFPKDSVKVNYINQVLSRAELSENNRDLLSALKNDEKQSLAFKEVLSPIFRVTDSAIGILTYPKYKRVDNRQIPVSQEMDLINKVDTSSEFSIEDLGKLKFYPMVLDSMYKSTSKPTINYYKINGTGTTKITELGSYFDECLEFYLYSLDTTSISKSDKILFSSPLKLDLIFESNPTVDSIIRSDYKKECLDCPNSNQYQKTFARIEGSDNLFFVYADTFPINDELDTPSRALVYRNKENEIIYLWYEEIDFFGCSCL